MNKKFVVIAIGEDFAFRMGEALPHKKLAEDAAKALADNPNNSGIVFRVEEVLA